jgi:hypothetical protein
MTDELPEAPPARGQTLDARLHLFDRQVLDVEDQPVTALDDVELTGIDFDTALDPSTPPTIGSLISGPLLTTRLFGGRVPSSRLHRIPWRLVADIGIVITLGAKAAELEVTWPERWLGAHVIGRIPGGRHDPH